MKSLNQKSKEGLSSGGGSLNLKKDGFDSADEGHERNLLGDRSQDVEDDQQFS